MFGRIHQVKLCGLSAFSLGRLIIDSISLIDINLFRLSISFCVDFGR